MKPLLQMSEREIGSDRVMNRIFDSINHASRETGLHRATIVRSLRKDQWVKDKRFKFEWLEKKPTIGIRQAVEVTYYHNGRQWDLRIFDSLTLASKHTMVSRDRIRRSSSTDSLIDDDGYQQNQMKFRILDDYKQELEFPIKEHICKYLDHQARTFNRRRIPLAELEERGLVYTTYYPKLADLHELVKEELIKCDGTVVDYLK